MRRKFIPLAVSLAAAVMALAVVTVGQAVKSDVFGSDHDLASPGNPACAQCHTPHNAQGSYLWAMTPSTSLTGLGSFCFSCHDGTVTDVGQFIADSNYESHLVTDAPGQDCDRCHDPHEGDNWQFMSDSIPVAYRNANVCSNCHSTGSFSHPVDELTGLPVDRTWNPYATPADFSGTQLWDTTGTTVVPTGDAYIKCKTCHVPHGAVLGSKLNSMAYSDPSSTGSPLCQNCHQ